MWCVRVVCVCGAGAVCAVRVRTHVVACVVCVYPGI